MVAVATGDIIRSTALPEDLRSELPAILRRAYAAAVDGVALDTDVPLALVGGDGWQCLIDPPERALPVLLRFMSILKSRGVRTRLAMALDEVSHVEEDLNASDGPAFRRSGRALEQMPSDRYMALKVPELAADSCTLAADAIADLVDLLSSEWTEAQAQAVAGMLRGAGSESVTQADVAASWRPQAITRQTVNRHLQRAYWPRLERTLLRYELLVMYIQNADG